MFRRKPDDDPVSQARSAMCCARLKDLLQRSVRELQQYQASHGFPEINSSLSHASDVCTALEAVFLHNFRPPFAAKMTSSLARLSRRQSMDRGSEKSYWPFVTLYTPRDFVGQLSNLKNVTSEVGQCRAWVRLALNDNIMFSYIEAVLADTESLSVWYSEGAFLLDKACAVLLRSLVQGLGACNFNLDYDSSALNFWTRQTLVLVGIFQPASSSGGQEAEDSSLQAQYPTTYQSGITGVGSSSLRRSNSQAASQSAAVVTAKPGETADQAISSLPSSFKDSYMPEVLPSADPSAEETDAGPDSLSVAPSDRRHSGVSQKSSPPSLSSSLSKTGTEDRSSSTSLSVFSPIAGFAGKSRQASVSEGRSGESASATMTHASVRKLKDEILPPSGGTHREQRHPAAKPVATSAMPTTSQSVVSSGRSSDASAAVAADQAAASQAESSKKSRLLHRKKDGSSGKKSRSRSKKSSAGHSESLSKPSILGKANADDGQMGLILKIATEHGLESQTYQCHGCARPIGVLFGPAKVCAYDGRYYCSECHLDEEEVIPARLVHNWDFHKYKVCKGNLEVLHFMEEQAIVDLASTNPSIYLHVPDLQEAKMLRSRLRALYTYVSTCKDPKILEEFQKRLPRDHLVQSNEHIYSVQDLLQVQSGVLVQNLKKLFSFASKHVHECQVCCLKGFICEICKDDKVIFAFDVAQCTQCAHCLAVFHRSCKEAVPCPKCQRLALRQQRYMRQSDDSDT